MLANLLQMITALIEIQEALEECGNPASLTAAYVLGLESLGFIVDLESGLVVKEMLEDA